MSLEIIIENLTNPALLFFLLGILAVQLKSDLAIPETSSKFISIYLLFSIGFKGGQELAHSHFSSEVFWIVLFGVSSSLVVPIYIFLLIRRKFGIDNAVAIAAAYGSISAVTFVTCVSFLELNSISFGGYMIALMALMEAPAIIVGVLLLSFFSKKNEREIDVKGVIKHAITNGSVLLILGSLIIGFIASEKQAQGISPFTTDIFKGFLAVFLLDMGIISGRKLNEFWKGGWTPLLLAVFIPLINGLLMTWLSGFVSNNIGDRLLLTMLVASASYIAVPASMKLITPKANPGLYIPMALAVTFPFNITLGMPLFYELIKVSL